MSNEAQRKGEDLRNKVLASSPVTGATKDPLVTGDASLETIKSSKGKLQRTSAKRLKRTQEQIKSLRLAAEKKFKKATAQTRKATTHAM